MDNPHAHLTLITSLLLPPASPALSPQTETNLILSLLKLASASCKHTTPGQLWAHAAFLWPHVPPRTEDNAGELQAGIARVKGWRRAVEGVAVAAVVRERERGEGGRGGVVVELEGEGERQGKRHEEDEGEEEVPVTPAAPAAKPKTKPKAPPKQKSKRTRTPKPKPIPPASRSRPPQRAPNTLITPGTLFISYPKHLSPYSLLPQQSIPPYPFPPLSPHPIPAIPPPIRIRTTHETISHLLLSELASPTPTPLTRLTPSPLAPPTITPSKIITEQHPWDATPITHRLAMISLSAEYHLLHASLLAARPRGKPGSRVGLAVVREVCGVLRGKYAGETAAKADGDNKDDKEAATLRRKYITAITSLVGRGARWGTLVGEMGAGWLVVGNERVGGCAEGEFLGEMRALRGGNLGGKDQGGGDKGEMGKYLGAVRAWVGLWGEVLGGVGMRVPADVLASPASPAAQADAGDAQGDAQGEGEAGVVRSREEMELICRVVAGRLGGVVTEVRGLWMGVRGWRVRDRGRGRGRGGAGAGMGDPWGEVEWQGESEGEGGEGEDGEEEWTGGEDGEWTGGEGNEGGEEEWGEGEWEGGDGKEEGEDKEEEGE